MMSSLYHAEKSWPRGVSPLFSAMQLLLQLGCHVTLRHFALSAVAQPLEDHRAATALLRAEHQRQAGPAGIGQLQLLPDLVITHRILDLELEIAQLVRQPEDAGPVLRRRCDEKHLSRSRRTRQQAALLQQLPQNHVAHPEAQRGQVYPSDPLQQIVVATPAADGAQRSLGIEQLEYRPGVVGEAAHDGEIEVRSEEH